MIRVVTFFSNVFKRGDNEGEVGILITLTGPGEVNEPASEPEEDAGSDEDGGTD